MKPQEIFDTVAKHLIQQGEMAHDGKFCCYRLDRDGKPPLMCAVGCLIPPTDYTPSMEGQPLYDLLCIHGDKLPTWMQDHSHLLADLQDVHDKEATWATDTSLRKALFQVSRDYGLSPMVLHA